MVSYTLQCFPIGETHACKRPSSVMRQLYIKTNSMTPVRTAVCAVALSFLVGSGATFAQDQPSAPPPDSQQQSPPANGQWRRAGDPPPAQSAPATPPAQATPPAEAIPPAEAA